MSVKTNARKKKLLKQLRTTPIVQVACEKTDVSRATYYRWRSEDKDFAVEADKALIDGSLLINDLAESQLISAIRDKNIHAIRMWLQNHHPAYANKLEINANIKEEFELSPEQEQLVKEALELAGLTNQSHEQGNSTRLNGANNHEPQDTDRNR